MRHTVLATLMPLLWHGLVDEAIQSLHRVPDTQSKNPEEIGHLISYLTSNRPRIPAYAVRREFGRRHASNRGEKSHDLIGAERQKHHGMRWSKDGSVAFASVTA